MGVKCGMERGPSVPNFTPIGATCRSCGAKNGQSPQFLDHDYGDQTAAWIKTPLGMEVDLGLVWR